MPQHILDAQQLHGLTQRQLAELVADRQAAGGRGGGAPPLEHKTLNRATILAAVGAWEAFVEDLATEGLSALPATTRGLSARKGWFPIKGPKSTVQTPSPANVRKLLWGLFNYDPIDDWSIAVTTNGNEVAANGGTWRVNTHTHTGPDAADFLSATVNVRHAFAHQDTAKRIHSVAGMAQDRAGGGSNVGSHHAENAISAVLQLAVLTTHGLARHLSLGEVFRYKAVMRDRPKVTPPGSTSWQWWMRNSPALAAVDAHWTHLPT